MLNKLSNNSKTRFDFWESFVNEYKIKNVLEIGIFKGNFSEHILKKCDNIEKYYMIDPWKHLDEWNKPSNKSDEEFEKIYDEAIYKTDFVKNKRIILRGETKDVIDEIPDNSLDFAYVDGDHTLRGIAIDLIKVYPKIKNNGWIGGDDFCEEIYQHGLNFDPTLIFPFAIYFAEAMDSNIFAIKNDQFLIEKNDQKSFNFENFTDKYSNHSLKTK